MNRTPTENNGLARKSFSERDRAAQNEAYRSTLSSSRSRSQPENEVRSGQVSEVNTQTVIFDRGSHTKAIVMSRVRAINFMRPFVSTGALSIVLIGVSVYAVSREIWVDMVLRNMPNLADIGAVANFFAHAFLHTGFIVQAFSVLALVATFFLVRESLKSLTVSQLHA